MKTKGYYAYIRVSKQPKPGEEGVSLPEQRAEIEEYARRHGLDISGWFEEIQTAASSGRPVFTRMTRLVRQGKAAGLLIHKIDRGTRNFSDWHTLGEMIDHGVDVHFCHDGLDMTSRGGRLAADMMVVIATDFIRNLREETTKGIRGRLRQGLYPMRAPVGYLDTGRARPKIPDPATAPLIQHAFRRYATGTIALPALVDELNAKGFRNKRGGQLSLNGLSTILNNPFYIGILRLKAWKEQYPGIHEPLVDTELFERVRRILKGRAHRPGETKTFEFRRLLKCTLCRRTLIGELQKGHRYYRCHTRGCPMTCVREELVRKEVERVLEKLHRSPETDDALAAELAKLRAEWEDRRDELIAAARASKGQIEEKLGRYADLLVDGLIDRETYDRKREELLFKRQHNQERLAAIEHSGLELLERIAGNLDLAQAAADTYGVANPAKRRALLEELTSNRWVQPKKVGIELRSPYAELANLSLERKGDPQQETPRTFLERLATCALPRAHRIPSRHRAPDARRKR